MTPVGAPIARRVRLLLSARDAGSAYEGAAFVESTVQRGLPFNFTLVGYGAALRVLESTGPRGSTPEGMTREWPKRLVTTDEAARKAASIWERIKGREHAR